MFNRSGVIEVIITSYLKLDSGGGGGGGGGIWNYVNKYPPQKSSYEIAVDNYFQYIQFLLKGDHNFKSL